MRKSKFAGTKSGVAAVAVLLVMVACVKNPATGKRELMLVSESQEVAMGQQASQQIPAELGLIEDRKLAKYVADKGMEMAKSSQRPDLPWEFHVVDSPVVNAFAIPGGFIYLTRGILAHMNTEAEMVGVLGHEIAHVTARHSAQQMSKAQLTNIGMGLGMVFVPEVRPYGNLLQTGLSLMFLKFGRDDEREADRLGIGYAMGAGYAAPPTADFFGVLGRLNEQSGQSLPGWLSTHPDPDDRRARILAMADAAPDPNLIVGEERFKKRLVGLVYGDNPREGFMDGQTFKHPEMRFQITFPEDWQVQNSRQAIYAGSRNAGFQLTVSAVASSVRPDAYASQKFRQLGLEAGRGQTTRINGFQATVVPFRVQTQQGILTGEAGFVKDGKNMYEMFAYTTPAIFSQMRPRFQAIIESFGRLTDRAALNRQPERLQTHRVSRQTTLRDALLRARVPEERLEELALINQGRLGDTVPAGTLLKIIKTSTRSATQ